MYKREVYRNSCDSYRCSFIWQLGDKYITCMCKCMHTHTHKMCLNNTPNFLFFCSKTGLVTTAWDRLYFFTQGGNLMCQPRGAVAGGMVLDLDNSSVMAVECEDRRYCFQITSPSGKTYAHVSPYPSMVIIHNTCRLNVFYLIPSLSFMSPDQ